MVALGLAVISIENPELPAARDAFDRTGSDRRCLRQFAGQPGFEDAGGKLMFHVIGAMAEFERALIQERVRAGLAVARSKGRTLGRPRVRRDRDKDAKRIRQLRDEGQSYREIAEELGRSTMDVHRVAMTLGCAATEQ